MERKCGNAPGQESTSPTLLRVCVGHTTAVGPFTYLLGTCQFKTVRISPNHPSSWFLLAGFNQWWQMSKAFFHSQMYGPLALPRSPFKSLRFALPHSLEPIIFQVDANFIKVLNLFLSLHSPYQDDFPPISSYECNKKWASLIYWPHTIKSLISAYFLSFTSIFLGLCQSSLFLPALSYVSFRCLVFLRK